MGTEYSDLNDLKMNCVPEWCDKNQPGALFPVAYRGFLAPGAKMGIGAPHPGVSDWQALKAISLAIWGVGGLGRSPSRQRFLEYLGVNGTHF